MAFTSDMRLRALTLSEMLLRAGREATGVSVLVNLIFLPLSSSQNLPLWLTSGPDAMVGLTGPSLMLVTTFTDSSPVSPPMTGNRAVLSGESTIGSLILRGLSAVTLVIMGYMLVEVVLMLLLNTFSSVRVVKIPRSTKLSILNFLILLDKLLVVVFFNVPLGGRSPKI